MTGAPKTCIAHRKEYYSYACPYCQLDRWREEQRPPWLSADRPRPAFYEAFQDAPDPRDRMYPASVGELMFGSFATICMVAVLGGLLSLLLK